MNILSKMIYAEAEKIVDNNVDLFVNNINEKSILITGASGLIGVNLIACLHVLNKKYNCNFIVRAINRNEQLKDLYNFSSCNVSSFDLTIEKCNSHYDIIIHAATYGQPGKFLADPIKTLKLNTSVLFNLFENLKSNGKFLFLSSSEVYSGLLYTNPEEKNIGKSDPYHPRACYIEGKRCGETIVDNYKDNFDVKSIRLALAYGMGTRKNDERVLNTFIRNAILKKKIQLLDLGLAKRTYIYISDAIELLWKILFEGKERLYNVGGNEKISILDLANNIGNILNAPVKLNTNLSLDGSPSEVGLNIDKIKNEFNPTFTKLNDGLKKTIKWQKLLYNKKD